MQPVMVQFLKANIAGENGDMQYFLNLLEREKQFS